MGKALIIKGANFATNAIDSVIVPPNVELKTTDYPIQNAISQQDADAKHIWVNLYTKPANGTFANVLAGKHIKQVIIYAKSAGKIAVSTCTCDGTYAPKSEDASTGIVSSLAFKRTIGTFDCKQGENRFDVDVTLANNEYIGLGGVDNTILYYRIIPDAYFFIGLNDKQIAKAYVGLNVVYEA